MEEDDLRIVLEFIREEWESMEYNDDRETFLARLRELVY